jgi:hypothetical protein
VAGSGAPSQLGGRRPAAALGRPGCPGSSTDRELLCLERAKAGCEGDANCLRILSARVNDVMADQWGRYRCHTFF